MSDTQAVLNDILREARTLDGFACRVKLTADQMLTFIGLLQSTARAPLSPSERAIVRDLLTAGRAFFHQCPTILRAIEVGDARNDLRFAIGPTGDPPVGDDPDDRGGLNALLSIDHATASLRLDFGTRLSFVTMSAAQARAFGVAILAKTDELERVIQ